ncbi:MAG TPA: calcium/sodium antiporter [Saprospiraceae bacterium]|nr:calcium/sodium antiporter [Saprospiraceae bacterium]
MDLLYYSLLFVVSLAVLLKASDWFIDSAERIGLSLGISPFIIGVTIVAFGTSLPELAASIVAVLKDESELVVSNVVGSNITNIALVLGLTAMVVKRIDLDYNIWHIDMPYLWGSAFILYFVLQDQHVSIAEAIIFLIGIVVFLVYSMGSNVPSEDERLKVNWKHYALLIVGGVLVAAGAEWTIRGIKGLSVIAGINSEIIGLSAVALGTSLPEVIVSLNAARKGKASIAIGNVLGSNIFNTYVVMSIPALIGPLEIPDKINSYFLPLMVVMTLMFGIISNNKKITRWEGAVLLMFYGLFFIELISSAIS